MPSSQALCPPLPDSIYHSRWIPHLWGWPVLFFLSKSLYHAPFLLWLPGSSELSFVPCFNFFISLVFFSILTQQPTGLLSPSPESRTQTSSDFRSQFLLAYRFKCLHNTDPWSSLGPPVHRSLCFSPIHTSGLAPFHVQLRFHDLSLQSQS